MGIFTLFVVKINEYKNIINEFLNQIEFDSNYYSQHMRNAKKDILINACKNSNFL